MSFITTYKKLCDCNLYHHYFLDDGTTAFDDNAILKTEQLTKYDFLDYASILPSEETTRRFKGQKIHYRLTSSGFTLFIKAEENPPSSGTYQPFIELAQTETFTFLIYINDGLFENYSMVNATPQIPLYFSNKKPTTEVGAFQYIDLETTTNDVADNIITQETFDLLAQNLTTKEKTGLFAIISLEIAGDDTTIVDGNTRNVLNADGTLRDPALTYKIQINNRSTIWNYRNPIDNSLIHSTDPTELPLVKNGIIGYSFDSIERPSAKPSRLIFEKDGGGVIIKTISEIYIN